MTTKKTAVVGAGWFGKAHIRNFYNLSNLVAICDENDEKLKELSEIYGQANVYTSIDELIKHESLDAVSIVTPPKNIPNIARNLQIKELMCLWKNQWH